MLYNRKNNFKKVLHIQFISLDLQNHLQFKTTDMKANELRIGNLVGLDDSEWNGFNQFFEFMSNSDVGIFLEDKSKHATVISIANEIELMAYGADLDYYAISEIQPIPLTEDWLVRFGFEKNEYRDNVFHLDSLDICFGWGWEEKERHFHYAHDFEKGDGYDCLWKAINYVHQLQNLYFALTGEELTIKL